MEADLASRQFNPHTEWVLDKMIFKKITVCFFVSKIDLFASRLNHQVPLYMSRDPDPGSIELGQMEEFYPLASCTSFTHYPEGAAGQGDNTASCSQLARATKVSVIVSDADRSPTAATNQGVAANPAISTQDDLPTVAFSAHDSMAHIRKRYRTAGLSSEVMKILLTSWSAQPPRKGTVLPGILWPSGAPVMDCVQFQHL